MDWDQVMKEVEDYLFPKMGLSHREKSLYYHLLLHTRFAGKDSDLFPLPQLSSALGIAERSVREGLRILHDKGCVRIEEMSSRGHLVHAFLPAEIEGLLADADISQPIDLETDSLMPEEPSRGSGFMGSEKKTSGSGGSTSSEPDKPLWGMVGKIKKAINRQGETPKSHKAKAFSQSESGHCFYCLKKLAPGTRGSNGMSGDLVACEECNAQKQLTSSEDLLRQLYRKGFLSATELEDRLQALGELGSSKGRL
ncbi:MAG: hypothetical protein GTO40_04325 [Deltaproteobacteria bacterium]|nr:hypothetical protein [Deltaproteobacteria bacterium]